MKKKIVAPIIILTIILCFNCNNKNYANNSHSNIVYIVSDNGLRVRSGPDIKSGKINVIPDKAVVEVIDVDKQDVTISSIKGRWIKIRWKRRVGWIFNGFTKETPAWLSEISGFWYNKKMKSAIDIQNIFSGDQGSLMGCPGGISPFFINNSYYKNNSLVLKVTFKALYEGETEKQDEIVIQKKGDKSLIIFNNVYIKSDKSVCERRK